MYLQVIWQNRKLIAISGVVLLLTSFYIYHLRATNKIERLSNENHELQKIVEQQQKTIENLKINYEKIIVAKDQLNKQLEENQQELDKLKETLFRETQGKKSLEELARKKTSLVEKKVNKATDKVLKCFETLSQGGDC